MLIFSAKKLWMVSSFTSKSPDHIWLPDFRGVAIWEILRYEVGILNQESSDICEIRPFFFFSLNIVIHSQPEDEMNVWILGKKFLQTSLGFCKLRARIRFHNQGP
jgi:hypothetical protein